MKPSTGAAVRLHRNAVRDRPESLAAFTGIRTVCRQHNTYRRKSLAQSAPRAIPRDSQITIDNGEPCKRTTPHQNMDI